MLLLSLFKQIFIICKFFCRVKLPSNNFFSFLNCSHLIKNVFLSVELKYIFYQAEFVFVFKFSVVISRSVALFLFLCRYQQNSQNFYAGKIFLQIARNFYPFFQSENAKNARKNKIGILPIMMLFIAIKAILMRFSSVFVKTHARNFFTIQFKAG